MALKLWEQNRKEVRIEALKMWIPNDEITAFLDSCK